jgi:hypothetical protein
MATHKCDQIEKINGMQVQYAEIKTDIKYLIEKVDAIHEQTLKTNGRVTKLETETIPKLVKEEIQPLKDWRNILIGAWIIVGGILLGSWGVLLNYLNKLIIK